MKSVRWNIWLALGITIFSFSQVLGQQGSLSPVAAKLQGFRSVGTFVSFDIFKLSKAPAPRDTYREYLTTYDYLDWDANNLSALLEEKPTLLRVAIPGTKEVVLELYRTDIFASGYNIKSSDGAPAKHSDMVFYHGQIAGKSNSLAAISVFENEIRIMYSDKSGSYRVQEAKQGRYIRFKETDQLNPETKRCFVDESLVMQGVDEGKIKTEYRLTGNCVEIYFECDRQSYLDNNSSVTETEAWVTALFNEVSILYENETIPISISQIMVWTTTDPYASLTSTSQYLNEFVSQIATNGYEGRLAHLLSTRSLGGGIAYVNVLCSTTHQCAVSASLSTNITPFPTYSWNVTVVAHETGHNFGSSHTHRCVWNGNSTQIDDCGSVWGSSEGAACYDAGNPILPETGGTVMSYCHLVSGVGINFNNGFGQQPGDLMRNNFTGAGCSTGNCFTPSCTALADPANNDLNVESTSIINWDPVAGSDGYKISMGTSSGGIDIANNIDVGTATSYNPNGLPFNAQIYTTIIPYNALGDADACTEESFHTEANIQPLCTQLSFPADGAVDINFDVTIIWPHAVGNQSSYILNVGLTSGGGEILNNINVGNVISYDLTSLPESTVIYVRVSPVGTQGSTAGCNITSFTVKAGLPGENCSEALAISCGNTVTGSTLEAQIDDVVACGTALTAPGVWYKFTGDGSNVTLSMCGAADYDTKLSVYRGSCAQLICVAGNDDWTGCNLASQVSFTSIPGAKYFVLVHGWNASIGNFNLTMGCQDPPYCPSQGIISTFEWISSFSLGAYTNNSGPSIYSDNTQQIIPLVTGESYDLSITPAFNQGTSNEYFRVWIDYNSDGDFNDVDEQVFEAGPASSTVNGTITIPALTTSGNKLVRVAMKYNAFSSSCDIYPYGEVEEYMLYVRCDVVTNTNDSGPGSLREALSCATSGDTIFFSPALQGQTIALSSGTILVNKSLVLTADPVFNISVSGNSIANTLQILSGNNVVIEGLNIIGGTSLLGNAIDNNGNLTLRDVSLQQHTGVNGATLLYNQGQIKLEGNCDIKDP